MEAQQAGYHEASYGEYAHPPAMHMRCCRCTALSQWLPLGAAYLQLKTPYTQERVFNAHDGASRWRVNVPTEGDLHGAITEAIDRSGSGYGIEEEPRRAEIVRSLLLDAHRQGLGDAGAFQVQGGSREEAADERSRRDRLQA